MMARDISKIVQRIAATTVVICAFWMVSPARSAGDSASEFIDALGHEAIEKIADKSKEREIREEAFAQLFSSSFAVKGIAKTVLGRRWNSVNDEQKERYLELFTQYIVSTYTRQFELFTDQTFEIKGEQDRGKKGIIVTMLVRDDGKKPVKVNWRVKQSKKTGKFYVVDIVVEGASLIITKRAEFGSMLDRSGGDFDKFLKSLADIVEKNSQA